MYNKLTIHGITIPTYGAIVLLGVLICFSIGLRIIKKHKLCLYAYLGITIIGGIGAVIGAKCLYIMSELLKGREICLLRNVSYQSGYSYYGGLIGFVFWAKQFCQITHTNGRRYARKLVFLLPLLHAFWKIACFAGGCCVGIPYDGPWAVCFPIEVNVLAGQQVFPVQIVEAIVALIIALYLFLGLHCRVDFHPVGAYFLLYGSSRFLMEFLRFQENGQLFSINHVLSIICVALGWYLLLGSKKKL